jgi:4'-phosphopantetheinyl transferase
MTGIVKSGSIEYVITSAADVLSAAARFGGAQAMLSNEELAKAERFRDPQDAGGYAAAHILFRVMATRALGVATGTARDLELRRYCRSCARPHGKPVIDGTNLSLSRVRNTVMIASTSPGQPIGADLEATPRELPPDFDDFALSPVERRQLASSDVVSRLRLWVAKEAVLKATGHGLATAPSTLHIGQDVPGPYGAPLEDWTAAVDSPDLSEAQGLQIAWVQAPAGYAAALAAFGQPAITRLGVEMGFEGS